MTVDYSDLEMAFGFVSSGYEDECLAYLDMQSGNIFYDSDASEDELPDDLHSNDKYLEIPSKTELGLGKPLAIRFAELHLPSEIDMVYTFFRSRGAYSNFKALLENRNLLQTWYDFEQAALKKEIIQWCADNEISVLEVG